MVRRLLIGKGSRSLITTFAALIGSSTARTTTAVRTTAAAFVTSVPGCIRSSSTPKSRHIIGTSSLGFVPFSSCPPPPSFFISTSSSLRKMSTSTEEETKKKRVLVPISDGSEEIETCCITDTLVRFGAEVVIASVKPDGELVCTMTRGVKMVADTTLSSAISQNNDWDLVVLPGGMPGSEAFRDCEALISLLQSRKSKNELYGAICAAPAIALKPHGLCPDGATCFPAPGLKEVMSDWSDEEVVVSGNVVTSQGPGTALKFALKLGGILYGEEKEEEIRKQLLV